MKKGQTYEGVVEKVAFPNKGTVNCGEEKAYVKGVLPGQKVSFVVNKKRNGASQGRLLEVIEPSTLEDCKDYCEHFGKCGGCSYLSMSYEHQMKFKEEQVMELLFGAVGEFDWDGIKHGPIERYRNKMEFTFGDEYKGGPLSLGMHKKNSFYDVVNLKDCRIVHDDINKVRVATVEFFAKIEGIKFYNRMNHDGHLRHLVVRRSVATGEILINLVTTSKINEIINDTTLVDYIEVINSLQLEGKINGILHTINDSLADVVMADEMKTLYGIDYFYEELLGLRFKITPFSFFQTNSEGAAILYDFARSYVGDTNDKVIFDLYSGTGTIAQMLSPVAKKVVGVEIVEEAVEAAKVNAQLNGIDNCEFIAGDVLKVIDDITDKPDIIVLDPPRDGINPKALMKIIAYGVNELVYISCKPSSLARDLEIFAAHGYEVKKGGCVDMFPGTIHVETVCLLSKK